LEYLGCTFLFYVGFYFYRLAENHKRNKWLFGFLGIALFVVAYLFYMLFCRFFNSYKYNVENLMSIGIKAFVTGFICIVVVFQILGFVWSRKKKVKENLIDKIGE